MLFEVPQPDSCGYRIAYLKYIIFFFVLFNKLKGGKNVMYVKAK